MNDALLKGIPFGLATGRSAESIERIIRRPFIAYLTARGHNPSDPRYDKLLISGNNGALTTVGLARPRVIEEHKLPLLELDRLPHDSFVRCALRRAYAMSSSAEAQRFSDGLPANTYDEYALYLNGEHFSRATSALTGEVLTPWALADEANEEFNRYGVDLRAHATKDGIDIVKGNVDKGLALNRYRDLAGIDETESSRVLCLGDSPAGNDRELLIHGGGRADIAPLGVSAVVEYARAMLGLPRDEASPKQTNAPESTGDTELEKEAA